MFKLFVILSPCICYEKRKNLVTASWVQFLNSLGIVSGRRAITHFCIVLKRGRVKVKSVWCNKVNYKDARIFTPGSNVTSQQKKRCACEQVDKATMFCLAVN